MTLIPDHLKSLMLTNGRQRLADPTFDPFPLVKLFTPGAACTWHLSDLYDDPDLTFGIADHGNSFPDLGEIHLSEISQWRGAFGAPVEADPAFLATKTLSAYAYDAAQKGYLDV